MYIISPLILSIILFCTACSHDELEDAGKMVEVKLSIGDIIDNGDGKDLTKSREINGQRMEIIQPFGVHHQLVGILEEDKVEESSLTRANKTMNYGVKCRFFAFNVERGTIDQTVDFTVGEEMPTVMIPQNVRYLFYAYSYNSEGNNIPDVNPDGSPDVLLLPYREGTGELLYWVDEGERIFGVNDVNRLDLTIRFERACSRIKVKLYGDNITIINGMVELRSQYDAFFKLRNIPGLHEWDDMNEVSGGIVTKNLDCSVQSEAIAEFFLIPQQLHQYTTFSLQDITVDGFYTRSEDIVLNYMTTLIKGTSYTLKIRIIPNSTLK